MSTMQFLDDAMYAGPLQLHPGYGWTTTRPTEWRQVVKTAVRNVRAMKRDMGFDAIAFCGSSGASIAFSLTEKLEIPIIYVRKDGEKAHGNTVESNCSEPINKYLIVDDFVASGGTVRYIIETIDKICVSKVARPPECVGAYMFDTVVDGFVSPPKHRADAPMLRTYGNFYADDHKRKR